MNKIIASLLSIALMSGICLSQDPQKPLQQIEQEANPGGNGNASNSLPAKVPGWVHSILRDIWQSRAAKQ